MKWRKIFCCFYPSPKIILDSEIEKLPTVHIDNQSENVVYNPYHKFVPK